MLQVSDEKNSQKKVQSANGSEDGRRCFILLKQRKSVSHWIQKITITIIIIIAVLIIIAIIIVITVITNIIITIIIVITIIIAIIVTIVIVIIAIIVTIVIVIIGQKRSSSLSLPKCVSLDTKEPEDPISEMFSSTKGKDRSDHQRS